MRCSAFASFFFDLRPRTRLHPSADVSRLIRLPAWGGGARAPLLWSGDLRRPLPRLLFKLLRRMPHPVPAH